MVHRVPLLPYNFYYTEPPPLPVRQSDDAEGPDFVIRAEIKEEHDRGIVLSGTTRSGQTASISIQIVAEGIARILLEGEESDPKRTRLARDHSIHKISRSSEQNLMEASLLRPLLSRCVSNLILSILPFTEPMDVLSCHKIILKSPMWE